MTEDGGWPLGPDRNLTLSNGPHAAGIVDRVLDRLVPFPAEDVGLVASGWAASCR